MAELTISPDEIRDALDDFVQSYQPTAANRTEVGTVVSSGDGIARVEACRRPWRTNCCGLRTAPWALP